MKAAVIVTALLLMGCEGNGNFTPEQLQAVTRACVDNGGRFTAFEWQVTCKAKRVEHQGGN